MNVYFGQTHKLLLHHFLKKQSQKLLYQQIKEGDDTTNDLTLTHMVLINYF